MTDKSGIKEALEKFFGHKSFKSELQERAVTCAVKSKQNLKGVRKLLIYTDISPLQKNRMCMCQCQQDRANHCAFSCQA